uniref:Toxin 34 isoform b S1 n=1 Tax=Cupiennius salei TaxID=6928 RepID=A0A4Y5UHA6_CUPSA|nr:toxin 34 isoform b S1 precursor [Cupiennius salei]QDC23122.1 toxin 34 isoform b S2 precursor [Cupiennius salei]
MMKFCIFFALHLVTIVCCSKDEILENEANAEDTLPVVQGENARKDCIKRDHSCTHDKNGCCWPQYCDCWSNRRTYEYKCECRRRHLLFLQV